MKARIGDIDIHYTIEGQGPWVTMSHSLACDISMWDAQAALLAPHYSVLRFDTRGHGQSSAPAGPYTMNMLAGDVHGLLQHLKIEHTHWVGLSMGGMIGQAYALECSPAWCWPTPPAGARPMRRRCGATASSWRTTKA